jgi:diamine N-acetyltransferase
MVESVPVPAKPVVNIVGERVALGPLEEVHVELLHQWHNDMGTMRTWDRPPEPETHGQMRERYHRMTSGTQWIPFIIYEIELWRPVGYTFLYDVDRNNKTSELVIMIGEPSSRGKGYGSEATRLILDFAFTSLSLSNVILRVDEFNLGAIRAYEKAGFKRIGVRRKSKMMNGTLWDTIYMDIIADEFESPVLGDILKPDTPR